MTTSGSIGKLAGVLLGISVLAACHTRPPAATPAQTAPQPAAAPAPPPPPPPPPPRAATPASVPLTEAERFARESLDQLNAQHPLSDVFFDYDENTLREGDRRALQEDAQWLKKWPSTVIRVDGHCDERGTGEYNLALGDRRSTIVRDYLVSLGVDARRVEVRSLGKEAPFCEGEGEACWAQNRRGHFVIVKK
jgi:peptidoglycan-associated lipoprotein